MVMDYVKLKANSKMAVVSVWGGPSGGTTLGITDVAQPAAAEINNTGGTSGMIPWSQSISWNGWDFGLEASEVNNEPSLADLASFEEFGASNYGGNIPFLMPHDYDDDSNLHSVVFDLTDTPGTQNDIVIRIDGQKSISDPAVNGDFVSVYRAENNTEENGFEAGQSKLRTVGFGQKSDFARYTIVGPHTITAELASDPWDAGRKARLMASVQGRDYTNWLEFTTSDASVVDIYKGGFYEVTGAAGDTATITIEDTEAGTSTTVAVTVTAP